MSKNNEKKSIDINLNVDIPGAKELGEAVKEISTDAAKGLFGFVGGICKPVAPQIGGLMADQVQYWRYNNFLRFAQKTKARHEALGIQQEHQVHPRVMIEIADGVMRQENETLLDWWAGLTVSACEECPSDEDIIFTEKMGKVTCLQAKVLEFSCENANVLHTSKGLLLSEDLNVTVEQLFEVTEVTDLNTLDRELDALRNHGLINGGFDFHKNNLDAEITPTTLGLHFYARCQGRKRDLIDFFSSQEMTNCPSCGRVHE